MMRKRNCALISMITLVVVTTVGCNPNVRTIENLGTPTVLSDDLTGYFTFVAWLSKDTIAVAYNTSIDLSSQDIQLYSYSLDNSSWTELPFEKPRECFSGHTRFLNRLSTDTLGFVYQCNVGDNSNLIGTRGLLYLSEPPYSSYTVWAEFPSPFHPVDFTFSQDMQVALQEKLDQTIYKVTESRKPFQVLTDFYQVTSPRWSPDGSTIVFAGISDKPDTVSTPFSLDPEGLLAKYDLYLSDPTLTQTQMLLADIQFPQYIKWSPSGKYISFWGRIGSKDGIWVLEVSTQTLTLLWAQMDFYDWSPDGTQVVLMQKQNFDEETITQPLIIDLPSELQDPLN